MMNPQRPLGLARVTIGADRDEDDEWQGWYEPEPGKRVWAGGPDDDYQVALSRARDEARQFQLKQINDHELFIMEEDSWAKLADDERERHEDAVNDACEGYLED